MAKIHTKNGFTIADISKLFKCIRSIINNLYDDANIGILNNNICINSSLLQNVSFNVKSTLPFFLQF